VEGSLGRRCVNTKSGGTNTNLKDIGDPSDRREEENQISSRSGLLKKTSLKGEKNRMVKQLPARRIALPKGNRWPPSGIVLALVLLGQSRVL